MTEPRNNAPNTRGRPFSKGNPGRPKGARHKVTLAVEALLEGEAEALTRKAIEKALDGDTVALRLSLDRIAPPRKDPHVQFEMAPMESAEDAAKAAGAILEAVANGNLTPSEGAVVARLVETYRRTLETENLERRVAALEGRESG